MGFMVLRMRDDKGCSLSPWMRKSHVSADPGAAVFRPEAACRNRWGNAAGQHGMRRHQSGSGRRKIARNRRCLRPRFGLVATDRHRWSCGAVVRSGSARFNWFRPLHTQRNPGEVLSVRRMIEPMLQDHDIARRRVSRRGLPLAAASTLVAALHISSSPAWPARRPALSFPYESRSISLPGWAAHELTIETTLALLGVVSERITLDRPCTAGVRLLTKPSRTMHPLICPSKRLPSANYCRCC